MNINPVVNIPNNATFVLKYISFPVVFAVLFFAGLKDAPAQITAMLGLFFVAMELSLIPYDIGKIIKDETHPYEYRVRAVASLLRWIVPSVTKYYSRNSLLLAKFLQVLSVLIFFGMFVPLFF